jgi:hypothetical protein
VADDFQRLLAGYRRAHRLLDILGVTYSLGIHGLISAVRSHRPPTGRREAPPDDRLQRTIQ